ncbi:Bloom syndrome protein-like [Actinia tenebrosa]|uniref:DNA 3'-5' helicase n=1 Tax=Actinia tenebrosa TaxID=6105 RepID=A0A6P8IV77_ACTTE|nr:Bloom syndrome protein-like [Actinia tenebrosa]
MERTIVYCKSIKDCGRLFKLFKSELGSDSYFPQGCQKESQNMLFGMFHHNTLDKHKDRILNSFHNEDGVCRLVFVTNALGMGINFPNVRTVINYGPPREVEELVQEVGRAGRDGQPALAVLLYHGRHLRKCEDTIIEYCSNSDDCLRKHLASQFEQIQELIFECGTHDCCLNCHQKCYCEEKCQIPIPCFDDITSNVEKKMRIRKVSKEDKTLLRELLMEHKDSQQSGLVTYLHPECTAGFSNSLVKAVIKQCNKIFTLEGIVSNLPVFKRSHAVDLLNMLNDVFEDIDLKQLEIAVETAPECLERDYDLTYNQCYEYESSSNSSEEEEECYE